MDGCQQLDMNPSLAPDNLLDGLPVNAILACKLALTGGPSGMGGANVKHLGFGQFGFRVERPTRCAATSPALIYSIGNVILVRA